jgi:hypothetical protein
MTSSVRMRSSWWGSDSRVVEHNGSVRESITVLNDGIVDTLVSILTVQRRTGFNAIPP